MAFTDDELRGLLDRYDQLVVDCVNGQISFRDFLNEYGAFYLEYALDCHESEHEERQLLKRFAERIELHRGITDSVIYRITSDELLSHPDAAKQGFIGSQEALTRVTDLASTYLNITRPD